MFLYNLVHLSNVLLHCDIFPMMSIASAIAVIVVH